MPKVTTHSLEARRIIKYDVEKKERKTRSEYVKDLKEKFPELTEKQLKNCVNEAIAWLRNNGVNIPKRNGGSPETPQSKKAKELIMADAPKIEPNNFYIKKLMDIFPELTRKKAQRCVEKAIVTLKKHGINIKDRRYTNKGKKPLERTLIIRKQIEEDIKNNLIRSTEVYISILIEKHGIKVNPASIKYVIQKMREEGIKVPNRRIPKIYCPKSKQEIRNQHKPIEKPKPRRKTRIEIPREHARKTRPIQPTDQRRDKAINKNIAENRKHKITTRIKQLSDEFGLPWEEARKKIRIEDLKHRESKKT